MMAMKAYEEFKFLFVTLTPNVIRTDGKLHVYPSICKEKSVP